MNRRQRGPNKPTENRYPGGKGSPFNWNMYPQGLVAKSLMLVKTYERATDPDLIDEPLHAMGVTVDYIGSSLEADFPEIFDLYCAVTGRELTYKVAWERVHKMWYKQGDPSSPKAAKGQTHNMAKSEEHPDSFALLREVLKIVRERLLRFNTVREAMEGWDMAEVEAKMDEMLCTRKKPPAPPEGLEL